MPDTSMKRCAVYTRKSSEEGLEQDFNSLQAQREACEGAVAIRVRFRPNAAERRSWMSGSPVLRVRPLGKIMATDSTALDRSRSSKPGPRQRRRKRQSRRSSGASVASDYSAIGPARFGYMDNQSCRMNISVARVSLIGLRTSLPHCRYDRCSHIPPRNTKKP